VSSTTPAARSWSSTEGLSSATSTTVKKLGLTTHFPTGSFDGALDAGQITGDLTVPTATTRMNIGKLRLAEVKVRVIPRGPSTATFTSTGWVLHLTSRQEVDIQLMSVKAFGLPLNLVGSRCKTATRSSRSSPGTWTWPVRDRAASTTTR
jgi:hypothetical protein